MIDRLTGKREFVVLQQHGQRRRSGPLWRVYAPDAGMGSASVAFALPRALGSAVVRNRIRRRLRAALRVVDAVQPLAPGRYLWGASAVACGLEWEQLLDHVGRLCDMARESGRREPADAVVGRS
jgi:ribonuclease P protein component